VKETVTTGSLESSDCLIRLEPSEQLEIDLETDVHEAFYEHIHTLISDTLEEMGVQSVYVRCKDQGALDFTIRARLIAAIERYRELHDG